MNVAGLYRALGPAIFARCRRLLGDERAAAEVTPRVFVRAQRRLTGDAAADAALLSRVAEEVCLTVPGPRLVRDDPTPSEAELRRAEERFARDLYRRTLLIVERDQRPPPVLRWLWVYAPIVVVLALTGMFFAAKYPMNSERFGGGAGDAGIELYLEEGGLSHRLATGMRVRRGERLRAIVIPAGHPYVTVSIGPRVHQRLGPLPRDAGRTEIEPIVVDGKPLRVSALFGRSPRGLPIAEASIVLEVE
jgi:hypothetical protein